MPVKALPTGYPRVIPYLVMDGAADAIKFYTKVFGAKQRGDVMPAPDGKIGHAELELGGSIIMLADPDPMMDHKTAKELGGSPVNVCVYLEDCDAAFNRAKEHGAKVVQDLETKFYGDRSGSFEDPWGYSWTVMTHVEDVSREEMERRVQAMMQKA